MYKVKEQRKNIGSFRNGTTEIGPHVGKTTNVKMIWLERSYEI